MKIRTVTAELLHANGRTGRQTYTARQTARQTDSQPARQTDGQAGRQAGMKIFAILRTRLKTDCFSHNRRLATYDQKINFKTNIPDQYLLQKLLRIKLLYL